MYGSKNLNRRHLLLSGHRRDVTLQLKTRAVSRLASNEDHRLNLLSPPRS